MNADDLATRVVAWAFVVIVVWVLVAMFMVAK